MISKNFYEFLDVVAEERGLPREDVLTCVKTALTKAVTADGHNGIVEVEFNDEAKKIRIHESFNVVETVDYKTEIPAQITLEQAQEIKPRAKIGQVIKREIDFKSLGRKSAFRFKQIFNQELRLLEIRKAHEYFNERVGEIITATIEKITDKGVILNIGMNTQTFMPADEGLMGERYEVGRPIKVTITKVEEGTKGPKVYVSRSQRDIIKRLFELYVPEVATGVVDVMNIARDPGSRTKIGIRSNNPNVDAKGACVGVNGTRIKQINDALNGERIDIFEWSDNPIKLIAEALTPAKAISVLLSDEDRKAIVIVPDDQFSLAIGKGGQNVRLASQAIGWKIDLKDETSAYRDEIRFTPNV